MYCPKEVNKVIYTLIYFNGNQCNYKSKMEQNMRVFNGKTLQKSIIKFKWDDSMRLKFQLE